MERLLINIIASSSKGNCIALNDNNTFLLLDFGVDDLIWKNAKSNLNITTDKIAGILLTHYHIDHIKTIIKNDISNLKFFTAKTTADFILNKYNKKINYLDLIPSLNKWIKIPNSNWKIKAIRTNHDAKDSLAFIIKNKKQEIVYITDTKYFVNKQFKHKNIYIIEAPFGLEFDVNNKVKISNHLNKEHNHLKLAEAEQLLKIYCGRKTKLFIFSHLNPNTKDFSIIENICQQYTNKKLKVSYIAPNDILKQNYSIS